MYMYMYMYVVYIHVHNYTCIYVHVHAVGSCVGRGEGEEHQGSHQLSPHHYLGGRDSLEGVWHAPVGTSRPGEIAALNLQG